MVGRLRGSASEPSTATFASIPIFVRMGPKSGKMKLIGAASMSVARTLVLHTGTIGLPLKLGTPPPGKSVSVRAPRLFGLLPPPSEARLKDVEHLRLKTPRARDNLQVRFWKDDPGLGL